MKCYDRESEILLLNLTTSSLEVLMRVDMAVEGILRLLFAAFYLMFNKVSNDSEVSAASRYDVLLIYQLQYLTYVKYLWHMI